MRTSGGKAAPAAPSHLPAPASAAPRAAAPGGSGGFFDALGVVLGLLFLPGLFLTLLFALLPAIHRSWINSMEAAGMDLDLPIAKARQELQRKKDDKLEEVRKKEKELKYKQDDIHDRRLELDQREKDLVKSNAPKEQFDALGRDRENLTKEEDALFRDSDRIREERQKLEASLSKQYRADEDKIEQDERERTRKRDKLELDKRAAEVNLVRWSFVYQVGLLFGLLVLVVGSVGYISSRQSLVRRIVGAIAIAAVVLLVVARMNGGRGVLLGLGGDEIRNPKLEIRTKSE